jgi:hypothetical protein
MEIILLEEINMNYENVPKIIAGKDLDYLSDMFNWNYTALKSTNESINNVEDNEIIAILEKGFNLLNNNLNVILSILNEGGNDE